MASAAPHPVYALGVPTMNDLECAMQAVGGRGHGDKVRVVGHQAIGDDLDDMLHGALAQQVQVGQAVAVPEEHRLAVVTPLDDVVRDIRENESRMPRHDRQCK